MKLKLAIYVLYLRDDCQILLSDEVLLSRGTSEAQHTFFSPVYGKFFFFFGIMMLILYITMLYTNNPN